MLEAHPATHLFPMLGPDELRALADDIAAHGLLHPVVLHESRVLDGRNRLRACELAGVEPTFVEWESDGVSPAAWVIATNLHRRHLTISQRAAIAAEALPLLEQEARERQGGSGRFGSGSIDPEPQHNGRSNELAARQFDVSPASVKRAKRLKAHRTDLFEEVKEGHKTVSAALTEAGLEPPSMRNGRPEAPSQPPRVDKSREATKARHERIAQMAREGYRVESIAAAIGITHEAVRRVLYTLGIQTVTQKIGKGATLNANRIMEGIVSATTPATEAIRVLDWAALDRERFHEWDARLTETIRELTQLRNRLRKETSNGRD